LQRHVRIHLVDGRTLLVGFHDIQLRDQHNRPAGPLTLEQAEDLLGQQPEPQRSSGLDVLGRHHRSAAPPR
jgi:hypothetical protein